MFQALAIQAFFNEVFAFIKNPTQWMENASAKAQNARETATRLGGTAQEHVTNLTEGARQRANALGETVNDLHQTYQAEGWDGVQGKVQNGVNQTVGLVRERIEPVRQNAAQVVENVTNRGTNLVDAAKNEGMQGAAANLRKGWGEAARAFRTRYDDWKANRAAGGQATPTETRVMPEPVAPHPTVANPAPLASQGPAYDAATQEVNLNLLTKQQLTDFSRVLGNQNDAVIGTMEGRASGDFVNLKGLPDNVRNQAIIEMQRISVPSGHGNTVLSNAGGIANTTSEHIGTSTTTTPTVSMNTNGAGGKTVPPYGADAQPTQGAQPAQPQSSQARPATAPMGTAAPTTQSPSPIPNPVSGTSNYTYTHREIVGTSLLDPRTYFGRDNSFFTNMGKDAKALVTEFTPAQGESVLGAGRRALGNQQVAHGTVNLMARGMVGLGVANVIKGVGLGIFDKVTGDSKSADEHFAMAEAHGAGVVKTAVITRGVGFLAKIATKFLPFLSKGLLGRIPIIGGAVTYYFGRQEISDVEDMVKNGQATEQMLSNTKTAVAIQSIGNILPFAVAGEVGRDIYALYSGARDGGENRPNFGLTGSLVQGALGFFGFGESPVAHAPSNPMAFSKGNAFHAPIASIPVRAPVTPMPISSRAMGI